MQLFQCFLLGLTAAVFSTAASIRARLSNLVHLTPSINTINPANVSLSNALDASTALNTSLAPNISTALDLSTALNGSKSARTPLNVLISEGYLSTIESFHGAILLEAQATARRRPVLTPATLTDVRLILAYGASRTIYREMHEWGVWGPPRVLRKPPPQNDGPLPFEIEMDIVEANNLLRQAGFTDKYDIVDVRLPRDIPQRLQQVFYIFSMVGNGPPSIAVSTSDGSVEPQDTLSIGDGWLSGNASYTI